MLIRMKKGRQKALKGRNNRRKDKIKIGRKEGS